MRINNKSSINFIIIFLSFFVIGCFGIPRKVIITPTLEILDQQTVSWLGDTVSKDQLDNTLQKYYRRTNSAVKKTIQVRLKSSAESSTTQKVKEILDKNKLPNIKHTVTKES